MDPGHGGIYSGTPGWDSDGPPEKEQNLRACQVLDRILYYAYDFGGGDYHYEGVIHTRIDDSYFSGDRREDLERRAMIANGQEYGWYNANFPPRSDHYPPPDYTDPWWIQILQKADFFLSYHYNASEDENVQHTDCHYWFDPNWYDPVHDMTNEDDRRAVAAHMVEQISAQVTDVYVAYPAAGWPFYFSTSPGSAINSNFLVLKSLDYTQIERGGALLEPLFYTNYDVWRALNAGDDPNWVVENICYGIRNALYNIFTGIPTGLEDGLAITECPEYLQQNTTVSVTAEFADEAPPNVLG